MLLRFFKLGDYVVIGTATNYLYWVKKVNIEIWISRYKRFLIPKKFNQIIGKLKELLKCQKLKMKWK